MSGGVLEIARDVAKVLADLEHRNFARRLGLLAGPVEHIAENTARKAASVLDDISFNDDAASSRVAVLIMSILWEYSSPDLRAHLRERFIVVLSRLGLSPTTAMIDQGFAAEAGYGAFSSFRAEIATLAMQIQYSVVIRGREFLLTRFQKKVVDAARGQGLVAISAPTSAGKSFAIYLAILEAFVTRAATSVIYVVPTVSLINQVVADLGRMLSMVGISDVGITGTCDRAGVGRSVHVLTQERALWGLESNAFGKVVDLLVVDEVQNLERVGNDGEIRSKMLLDVLTELTESLQVLGVIISGPMLEGMGLLGSRIFGRDALELSAQESPVASLTYSISKAEGRGVLTQHREALDGTSARLDIGSSSQVKGLGSSAYTEEFLVFLSGMIASLGSQSQNIVFSPTADQSVKTASKLGHAECSPLSAAKRVLLSEYLASSVHPDYTLTKLVISGGAYHNGKVPPHARFAVEESFREGTIRNLVCTTTLMQGVNLPANVVFVRNPKLYVRASGVHGNAELSAYEFANLRGRAGRLMRDLVGRTVVLDEESFTSHRGPNGDLFEDVMRTIKPGYADMFSANQAEILEELRKPSSASGSAKFLAGQIRQTAIRLGANGLEHLLRLGIVLPDRIYAKAIEALHELTVEKSVCLGNRYWDPFDLQLLQDSFEASKLPDIPDSVWDKGLAGILTKLLEFHSVVAPYYFKRSLRSDGSDRFFYAIAKTAESWAREIPLRTIVEDRHFPPNSSNLVDDQIGLLYKHVVFGLPSLLKPISDIRGKGTAVLAAIENGAFNPATRFLMERGVFRETAVEVRRRLLPNIGAMATNVEGEVLSRVKSSVGLLGPWIQRQMEAFV